MTVICEISSPQKTGSVPAFPNPAFRGVRKRKVAKMTEDTAPDWSDCLIRIARDQDKKAFAMLFRHFAPRVKSYLLKRGASHTQADDAMQEAMATVWRKAHLFDPTKAAASTWVFTIARNKFLDAVRKQARPEPEMIETRPEYEDSAEDAVSISQESEILRSAIRRLPPKQREMIERAYLGELTHAEISQETELPLGTIKSRIRLGLERLRHEIAPAVKDRT